MEECGVGGRCPQLSPYTHTRESPPAQFLDRGSPSRLRASLLPQMPGCKERLGLAPPPWRLKISHSNCTLETRQGEKINEEKLDREKKKKKTLILQRLNVVGICKGT